MKQPLLSHDLPKNQNFTCSFNLCIILFQEADGEGRRMAMDGNMTLVHREKAGHSVRDPIHQGRFFLPQNEVDDFLGENAGRSEPDHQVSRLSTLSIQFAPLRKKLY